MSDKRASVPAQSVLPFSCLARRGSFLFLFWLIGGAALLACGGRGGNQRQAGEVMSRTAGGELAYLEQFVGKRPSEVNLWQTEPLQARLRALLGDDFDTFRETMQEAGPLSRDGVLYTIGVVADDAVPGIAYLLVDTEKDQIRVYAIFGDLVIDEQTAGASFTIPAAVTARVKQVIGQ